MLQFHRMVQIFASTTKVKVNLLLFLFMVLVLQGNIGIINWSIFQINIKL